MCRIAGGRGLGAGRCLRAVRGLRTIRGLRTGRCLRTVCGLRAVRGLRTVRGLGGVLRVAETVAHARRFGCGVAGKPARGVDPQLRVGLHRFILRKARIENGNRGVAFIDRFGVIKPELSYIKRTDAPVVKIIEFRVLRNDERLDHIQIWFLRERADIDLIKHTLEPVGALVHREVLTSHQCLIDIECGQFLPPQPLLPNGNAARLPFARANPRIDQRILHHAGRRDIRRAGIFAQIGLDAVNVFANHIRQHAHHYLKRVVFGNVGIGVAVIAAIFQPAILRNKLSYHIQIHSPSGLRTSRTRSRARAMVSGVCRR